MKKKVEIEIEVNETVAYSRSSEKFEAYCPQCGSLVEMAVPQTAALLVSCTEREIYRLIESDQVHFTETDRLLVCLSSLRGLNKHTVDVNQGGAPQGS
jgi:hypothetical protein